MNSPRIEDLPDILSVSDAASFLGVDRKTIYQAVGEGSFPGRRVGARRVVVLRDALLDWLRSSERVSPSRQRRSR